MSFAKVLDIVREFRAGDGETPVVLMGYLNPLEAVGYARAAGTRGGGRGSTESSPWIFLPRRRRIWCARYGHAGSIRCFWSLPRAATKRIARICGEASGFVYYVSLKGVTGAATLDVGEVAERMARIRRVTELPVGVGFGIRDGDSAARIARVSDAVVVGTAVVARVEGNAHAPEAIPGILSAFIAELRNAMDAGDAMSWFGRLLPSRIRTDAASRRTVPEGLWTKCSQCNAVLYRAELERNAEVCPKCGHHMRQSARRRLHQFLDEEPRVEIGAEIEPVDVLRFRSGKKYQEQIGKDQKATGEKDALVAMMGRVRGIPLVAVAFEYGFRAGSMGSVVGERFVRAVDAAVGEGIPLVAFACSGGARMQEGLFALFQMAKTSAALARLQERRLPYVSVLTDPTTGGVSASLGMLGDRQHRGARRPHLLHRSAGHRADDRGDAPRRIPAQRISAEAWGDRHDRRPARAA